MKCNTIVFAALYLISFNFAYSEDFISADKERWRMYYTDNAPNSKVTTWYLPFDVEDRQSMKYLRNISPFGSSRSSFKKGHYHSGLDCMPKKYSEPVWVYAMSEGVVCSIHLSKHFKTVVVKHVLSDSTIVFSSYKHINDIKVAVGDQVNKNNKIARVLTKKEAHSYKGAYDYLHLEIRKSFDDFGCASWLTMTKEVLNYYFYDPDKFMKKYISK